MNTVVRISFRQNAEYLMAGQNEVNALNTRAVGVSPFTQNVLIAIAMVGALVWAAWDQLSQGTKPKIVVLSVFAVIVIGIFWIWFFKKIGLGKSSATYSVQLTQKDLPKYQKYHRKVTGADEILAIWEFDRAGLRLMSGDKPGTEYNWSKVKRVVERLSGFLIFVQATKIQFFPVFLWFPREAFATEDEYKSMRGLFQSAGVEFEKLEADADLPNRDNREE